MEVMFKYCAGLDVHKKIIVACVLLSSPEGVQRHHQDVRHDAGGSGSVGRLADRLGCHPRGDGKYGGVLEAGVQRAGRRCLRSGLSMPGT